MIKARKLKNINKLFKRYSGWSGADGIYSFKYENKIFCYFSDTFIGESDKKTDKRINYEFINNSALIMDKNYHHIYHIYRKNPTLTLLHAQNEHNYFWLEDGLIIDNFLYVFAINMVDRDDKEIPFEIGGNALIKIDLKYLFKNYYKNKVDLTDDYSFYKIINFNSLVDKNIILGNMIIKVFPYYYIYGYINNIDNKKLILCRTKSLENLDLEFYLNDLTFKKDTRDLLILKEHFTTESKIYYSSFDNHYYIAYTKNSVGNKIYLLRIKDILNKDEYINNDLLIYECEEFKDNIITYNAKIQDGLIKNSKKNKELIISYNVNSLDDENTKNVNIYRPRFLKINLKEIIKEYEKKN